MRLSSLLARFAGHDGSFGRVRGALVGSVLVSFTGQALLAISGVLVARLLGPEDRGRLAFVVLVPVVFGQLVTLGLPLAITYFTAIGTDPQRMLRHLRRSIVTQFIVACVLCAAGFMALAVFDSLHAGLATVAALLVLPGGLMLVYGLAPLQGLQRFRAFNVLRQAPAALYLLGVIGLYAAGTKSILALTVVWSASYILVGLVAFTLGLGAKGGTDDPPSFKKLLRFGLRGFLGASSPIDAYRLDQVTIGVFLSPVSLGLYVVGLAFTNLPQFIAQGIGMVAYPDIAGIGDRAAAWRAVKEYVAATSVICVLVCGILILFADRLIVVFFGEDFASATEVTRVLLCGAAIVSVRRLLGDAVRGIGMPGASSIAEVASWVALLPALAICIPLWGIVGAAVALTTSYAASLAVLAVLILRNREQEGDLTGGAAAEMSLFIPEA